MMTTVSLQSLSLCVLIKVQKGKAYGYIRYIEKIAAKSVGCCELLVRSPEWDIFKLCI